MGYMNIALLFLIFTLGLALGSFLNVVEWRGHQGTSWVKGRSRCRDCEKQLAWYDVMPLVSFFLLGGKCRHCEKNISRQYFVVELWMGLVSVLLVSIHGVSPFLVRDIAIVWVLTFIFITDLKYLYVEEVFVLAVSVLLFIASGIMGWHSWDQMIMGVAVAAGFFLLQYFVSRGKWIGRGDISIGVLMGVILGWPIVLIGLFIVYVSGALIEGTKVLMHKRNMKDRVALGTYLTLATFFTMILYG